MALSNTLASQFAKAVKPDEKEEEQTLPGTYKQIDNQEYVQLDGSEIWTPVKSTVTADDGDKVNVMIKDHDAIVTGNISSPSARSKDVESLKDAVDENGNTIKQMDNVITQQGNSIIEINNNIDAQNNTITAVQNSVNAQDNKLTAMDNDITAQNTKIDSLNSTIETQGSTISSLNDTVTSNSNDIKAAQNTISAQQNTITQQGNTISEQGTQISTANSRIDILDSGFTIKDGKLTGLSQIVVNDLETNTLKTKYADIDFANINYAAVKKIFADSGIINDLVVNDQHITGELVGVTIKGDLIEGNTIKADKLVVKGEDGLYYKLNTEGISADNLEVAQDETNSLNGSVITAKSITATQISVQDLVAFGATIGGFQIDKNSIHSTTKNSIDNQSNGLYMDNQGQMYIGNDTDYVRYYKELDENGKDVLDKNDKPIYHLDISSGSIDAKIQNSTTNITNQITEINANLDGINSKVDNFITDADITTDSESTTAILSFENINHGEPIEIKIHPINTDIAYLYPNKNINTGGSTYFKIRDILFTNTTTNEKIKYTLPDDLLYLDENTYDEFHLDYINHTCSVTKRVGINDNLEKYKLTPEKTVYYDYPVINLTDGNYIVTIPTNTDAYMYVRLMIQNEYTSVFATKVELNSSITQTRDEINLNVNNSLSEVNAQLALKVNRDTLASEIDAVADEIRLTGLVTANENFKILKDGSIQARNGTFSGNIYLDDGQIAIGKDGVIASFMFKNDLQTGWGGHTGTGLGQWGVAGWNYQQITTGQPGTDSFAVTGYIVNPMTISVHAYLPKSFHVIDAYIVIQSTTINTAWYDQNDSLITGIGYPKQLQLYYTNSDFESTSIDYYYDSEYYPQPEKYSEKGILITDAFGSSEYTPNLKQGEIDTVVSASLKNYIRSGADNIFYIKSNYPAKLESYQRYNEYGGNYYTAYIYRDVSLNTGLVQMTLYVYGYMDYGKE